MDADRIMIGTHLQEYTTLVVTCINTLLRTQNALPFAATQVCKSIHMISMDGLKK